VANENGGPFRNSNLYCNYIQLSLLEIPSVAINVTIFKFSETVFASVIKEENKER
jgi:hypothetical protein